MNDIDNEFEQLYTEFQPKIHRYLVRMVGEQEAEDLTQEVFIKLRCFACECWPRSRGAGAGAAVRTSRTPA